MRPRGRHLLVEYAGCDRGVLDDPARLEALMTDAARAAGARVVATVFQPFQPQGVTGVVVIEESHLSIHTWPEHGYAAVDFFTCGGCAPERAHDLLAAGLGAQCFEILKVDRGLPRAGRMIRVRSHRAVRSVTDGSVRTAPQPSLVGRGTSGRQEPDPRADAALDAS